ncbi:hypothetical protein MIR68_012661 [Amoeboaphelidium protococcarum]|nr:hypothetical protein MIR68_012661 [Amoeboaphelidium protococcarum]
MSDTEDLQETKAALKKLAMKQQEQSYYRKKTASAASSGISPQPSLGGDIMTSTTRDSTVGDDNMSVVSKNNKQTSIISKAFSGTKGSRVSISSESLNSKNAGTSINTTVSGKKEIYVEEKDYKLALLQSKLLSVAPRWQSFAVKARFERYEKLLRKLRDPVDGVHFKDIKGLLNVQPLCATGYDIAVWFLKELNALNPADAKLIIQNMTDNGYIISVDDNQQVYREDDSLYTYQADFFYPSRFWETSDLDYYLYLKRKSNLNSEEKERLATLGQAVEFKQDLIREMKDKQKAHFSRLDRGEKKLFELREAAFWKVQRPLKASRLYIEETPITKIKKHRYSPEKYEKKLKDEAKVEAYLKKQVDNLTACLNIYRLPTSTAVKNLITRIDMYTRFDPLVRSDLHKNNPWDKSETEKYVEVPVPDTPSFSHARMWNLGLRDVLQDPLGLKWFMTFLEKDYSTENLKFYLACQELESIMDRTEYFIKCKEICYNFVAIGSPNELNLLAGTRDTILADIKAAESNPNSLDINVLRDAYDHIFQLMQKASFPRFMQSAEIKSILAD